MQFWYVPANYHGRGYGGGIRGYGMRGFGTIVGGPLDDLGFLSNPAAPIEAPTPAEVAAAPVQVPVSVDEMIKNILNSPAFTETLLAKVQDVVAQAEATKQPVPITKKEAGLWSGIKNIASKAWDVTKKVASNPIVKAAVPFALGVAAPYAMPYLQKGMDVVGRYTGDKLYNHYHPTVGSKVADVASDIGSNIVDAVSNVGSTFVDNVSTLASELRNGANSVGNATSWLWPFGKKGNGYGGRLRRRRRGRARFRKGSPEAKAYMAMLRARRRGKRGRGYMGGMVKGWNLKRLNDLLSEEKYADASADSKIGLDWIDKWNKPRVTNMSKKSNPKNDK